MARILWLDDELDVVYEGIESLLAAGHEVWPVSTEELCVKALQEGELPDLLIQDLHRPLGGMAQLADGRDRLPPSDPHLAGWHFYEEVLRPSLPALPTLIFTSDASHARNLKRADDFNISMLDKSIRDPQRLGISIQSIIAAQRPVLTSGALPTLSSLNFDVVNERLLRHLALHPTDLHQVSWSAFEKLVAHLLAEMGFQVERTPLTRDGGVDIWAIRKTELGEVLYAIDAKKYSPNRTLAPSHVRAIHGVADLSGANVGMIVTTARFGPAARKLGEQLRYRLSLKELNDVIAWIRATSG